MCVCVYCVVMGRNNSSSSAFEMMMMKMGLLVEGNAFLFVFCPLF